MLFALLLTAMPFTAFGQTEAADTIYKQGFNTQQEFNTMTVIDRDADSNSTWAWGPAGYNKGYAWSSYSNSADRNNWLLTPAIQLEGGRTYIVTYKSYGAGSTEKVMQDMNITIGTSKDTKKHSVVDKVKVRYGSSFNGNCDYKSYLKIKESGAYRIGFNDVSVKGSYPIYLDDIVIAKGSMLTAPDSVTNLKAVAAEYGQLSATVSFTVPTKTVAGEALTSLTKAVLMRDGKTIKEFASPTPGETLTYADNNTSNGTHEYTVYISNEAGDGIVVSTTAFTGIDVPGAPTNTNSNDLGDKIVISWDAPTSGANGYYIDKSALTYNVYVVYGYANEKLTARNVKGTSIELENNFEGNQAENKFSVRAVSVAGEGEGASVPAVILGTPYELPFTESFENATTHSFWWKEDDGSYNNDGFTYTAIKSADDDGACAAYFPIEEENWANFNTGKISLKGTTKPTLKFCYLFDVYTGQKLEAYIHVPGKADECVYTAVPDGLTIGWKKDAKADLTKFINEPYIIVKFKATGGNGHEINFDNVSISDGDFKKDLAATLSARSEGVGGENTTVSVRVANFGDEAVSSYEVDLMANGKTVATQKITKRLSAMKSIVHTLNFTLPIDASSVVLTAKVTTDGDENPNNDETESCTMTLTAPVLSAAHNLVAEKNGTSVTLNWEEPSYGSTIITEDFEDYEPFNIKDDGFGKWTCVDGDQGWTTPIPYYANNELGEETKYAVVYPGNVQEEAFAWMVFNPSQTTPNVLEYYSAGQFAPHSGNQYIIASCSDDIPTTATTNDDWLVSPLLTGEEQTIKFWVMSPSTFTESFEVYVSKNGSGLANFDLVDNGSGVTGSNRDSWQEVEFKLPEGSKYFAIRYCSDNLFMMGIDDITYSVGDGVLKGYNIYRDGEFVANIAADATTYVDNEAGTNDHAYTVTAVYTRGESVPSNVAATSTGINNITTAADGKVQLYDMSGRRIQSAPKQGVYIVRNSNGKTYKLTGK